MNKQIDEFLGTLGISPRLMSMIVALAGIWIGLHLVTDGIFLSARNLYNLAVQTSVVGIMSTGMVLIIVSRYIDLSVGSLLGATGMVVAYTQVDLFTLNNSWSWVFSIVIGLGVGAVAGFWQGYWVAYRGVPAFIVTLGGLLMFRGGAFLVTDGRTVAPMDPIYQLIGGGINGALGQTWSWIIGGIAIIALVALSLRARAKRIEYGFPVKPIWAEWLMILVWAGLIAAFVMVMNSYYKPRTEIPRGIPIPVLILIVIVIAMTLMTKVTKFGRHIFAMGSNPEAAELAGIDIKKVTVKIFMLMGVLSSIAGIITTARLNAGTNSMGTLAELNVIAAAVIGGTSLAGGIGTIPGAILGAVIMQSLENGMVLLGVSSAMRMVVIGLVLIIAVWFDVVYNKNKK